MNKLSIQWQIGNQCNFRCDYCHSDFHSGSNPFLEYEQFQRGFRHLQESVKDYTNIEIEFQGGEPTISSAIRDKIADQTDTRYKYNLTTNASADLAWWKLAVKNLSNVIIAYHPYCDIQHFKQIVELVKDSDINFSITINAHNAKDRWTDAVNIYDYYKCKNYPISFRALFSDHARGNNKFLPYDYDQWAFYTEINKIDVPDAPVETQIKWVENHLYNNYKGHLCWAGVEQIVIDYFGYTYRGWCHSHGVLGNIFESSVVLDTQPKVCPRIVCKNLFDQQAKKSEKSWGL